MQKNFKPEETNPTIENVYKYIENQKEYEQRIFNPDETIQIIEDVCKHIEHQKVYDKLDVLNAVSYALIQAERILVNRNAEPEEVVEEETEFDDDVITIGDAANVFDTIFDAVIGQHKKVNKEQKAKIANHINDISDNLDDIVFDIEDAIVNLKMLVDKLNSD